MPSETKSFHEKLQILFDYITGFYEAMVKGDRKKASAAAPRPYAGQAGREEAWLYALLTLVATPLLVYLNLRCLKNLCILWYLPLVIPTSPHDYLSLPAVLIILGFVGFQVVWKLLTTSGSSDEDGGVGARFQLEAGFTSYVLLASCLGMLAFAGPDFLFLRPDFTDLLQEEYLKLLVTMILFCLLYSVAIGVATYTSFRSEAARGLTSLITLGPRIVWPACLSERFFLVNVGLVGWGLLDVLLLLPALMRGAVPLSAAFVFATQTVFIVHALLFEKFLMRRALLRVEKVGWRFLLKFAIFMPFLGALPLHYATVSDFVVLPQPVLLCNLVFFLFGFLVYSTANHQMDRFLHDPAAARGMEWVAASDKSEDKRYLVSGYWSFVRRPDYLGLLVMWTSWSVACGLSAMAMLTLVFVALMLVWSLERQDAYNQARHPRGWQAFTERVPWKILPYVY